MAKRSNRFLDKNRSEMFVPLVNQALDIAIRETRKSQGQIAKEIGVNKNTLTNWRKGRTTPSDRDFESLLAFLKQLDPPITEDYFTGSYLGDPYTEDPDYVAAMGEELRQYANDIGLNLNFLRFITDYIKSVGVDKEFFFYQWGPIRTKDNEVPSDPEKLAVHERLVPAESKVANAAGDFRVADRVLSKIDLNVIKDIQDHVMEDVTLRFIKRKLEMDREVREANRRRKEKYLKAKENAGGAELSDRDMVLTVGEMGEIDKYYKKCFAEVSDDTLITDIPWNSVET